MHLCLKIKAGMIDICCPNYNCPPEAMQKLAFVLSKNINLCHSHTTYLRVPEDMDVLSELVGESSWPTVIRRLCIH